LGPWRAFDTPFWRGWDDHPLFGLQRDMNRLFDEFFGDAGGEVAAKGAPALTPRADVSETDKEVKIVAELPGVEEKDVAVEFADGMLSIRAEKKAEREETSARRHLVERAYGTFERVFRLPMPVEEDKIQASFAKGVLTVTLPKAAEVEKAAKKIEIKAAA
jgi:HSP20 family protein